MNAIARLTSTYRYTLLALALLALAGSSLVLLSHLPGTSRSQGANRAANVARIQTPTSTPTPAVQQDPLAPPGLAGTWKNVFLESFNGQSLDASRWNTCFWWDNTGLGCDGSVANGELQRYLPANVTVHDGSLDIVARREDYSTDSKSYQYTSGIVTTEGKFDFRYGFVEARIRLSAGDGIWPAFWMLPQDHTSKNEIDIAEILCNRPDIVHTALHFLRNGQHASVGNAYQGSSFAQDYHVVAIDWEPQSVSWYVDGALIYQVTTVSQIPQTDMYLLLNTAVGGWWSGNPTQSTPFPHHFNVDWVQVWQQA